MGVRSFQTIVPMRDGTGLNTFVFLPESGGPRFPVILHRTPYGIAAANARGKFDHTNAWLPSAAEPMRGSILRGMSAPVAVSATACSANLLFTSSILIPSLAVTPVGMWARASISPPSELAREAGEAQPVADA